MSLQVKVHPQVQSLPELRGRIEVAWDQLEPAFIRNAANSLRTRAQRIIDAQGKPIPRRWL